MSNMPPSNFVRIAGLTVVLSIVLPGSDVLGHALDAKIKGGMLLAASAVFLISEAFFWKGIDKLNELPGSESLTVRESSKLADQTQKLKATLIQRWWFLLALKVVAGMMAAWLLNQPSTEVYERIAWALGTLCITVSVPLAMSFLRNWQAADTMRQELLIRGRKKKATVTALAELSQPVLSPLDADKLIAGYTEIVGKGKRKSEPKRKAA